MFKTQIPGVMSAFCAFKISYLNTGFAEYFIQ